MSMSAARGVARLARFEADGLAAFDATPHGLLNALAPWFAFALVGSLLVLLDGDPAESLTDLLASTVALLAPAVASHFLAGLWRRPEDRWLRYSVAVVWCQWAMPPALIVALTGSFMLIAGGVPEPWAERFAMLALLGYALALNLFVARRALDLSWGRAAVMVLAVNLATGLAVIAPQSIDSLAGWATLPSAAKTAP